jgi:hypothetical protein
VREDEGGEGRGETEYERGRNKEINRKWRKKKMKVPLQFASSPF